MLRQALRQIVDDDGAAIPVDDCEGAIQAGVDAEDDHTVVCRFSIP
jgi:hypothetical protein